MSSATIRRPGARRPAALVSWAVVAAVTALAVVALTPRTASAHAVLQEVSPPDGAALDVAPEQVSLRFDEPVTTPDGGIRVFDGDGERVDTGDAAVSDDGTTVTTALEEDLPDGTYVTTYRIASADGHPLRGAALFTVGAGAADTSLVGEVFRADADRGAAIAAIVVRWLGYAATLLAAGGALAGVALWPGLGGRRDAVIRVVTGGAVAAALLAVLSIVAQAALVTGEGLAVLVDLGALGDVAVGGVGISAWVRLLGLASVWWWTRTGRSAAAVAGGLVAPLSFALEGHTLTTSPAWLVVSADLVHLAAAAVWTGGLAVLAVAIGRAGVPQTPLRTARLIARFSGLATLSILALVAAGAALGLVEVRALRALTSTSYGWTLLVKLVLLAPVAAAAAYNHRRLVPRIREAARSAAAHVVPAGGSTDTGWPPPGAGEDRDDAGLVSAVARLRRTIRVELAGIAAVLAATAVLVGLQPAAEAAGIAGAYSTYVALGEDHELNMTVDPNRAGHNEIHLYVLGSDGRQAEISENVTVELNQPSRDIGPLQRETTRLGPGHFLLAGPELSVPGRWELTVSAPVTTFDVITTTVPVTVNPP